jgi:hypothetical protein
MSKSVLYVRFLALENEQEQSGQLFYRLVRLARSAVFLTVTLVPRISYMCFRRKSYKMMPLKIGKKD